jgi:drug/metabolite transporter (DMT)-like permease
MNIINRIGLNRMCMRIYILLAVAILAQAAGNVFLSKGMKYIASIAAVAGGGLIPLFLQAIGSPMIWLGTVLLIIFFLLFITVLSSADLSFVLPVVSIEVVVNVAFADFFLNEPVSTMRWLGTILISLGVIMVFRSGHQAVGARQEGESTRGVDYG